MKYKGRIVDATYGMLTGESFIIISEPRPFNRRGDLEVDCKNRRTGEVETFNLDDILHSLYFELREGNKKESIKGRQVKVVEGYTKGRVYTVIGEPFISNGEKFVTLRNIKTNATMNVKLKAILNTNTYKLV